MFQILQILTAIFAIPVVNGTIEQQLETIKANFNKEENIFLEVLPQAEAASNKKDDELKEKFKELEEQCKALDTLLRKEFDKPNLLLKFYPAKKFSMDEHYKEKAICEDFLKLEPHVRFKRDGFYDLDQLQYKLETIEKITNMDSEEMEILSGLKDKSIRLPIEAYDKIGRAIQELEKLFENLQNGNKEDEIHAKKSFKTQCEILEELIRERFNSADKFLLEVNFRFFNCNKILQSNVINEKKFKEFKELLQEMKEMFGNESHLKLSKDAKEKLILETAENLIETYHSIVKANAGLKNTLQGCKDLYFHDDLRAQVQIKYFVELTKIGHKFAEKLRKYFHNGQPVDQTEALKAEKDEFVKKLTSFIRYNGEIDMYIEDRHLERNSVAKNREHIFDQIVRYLILPKTLAAEKEIIRNAEKAIMECALELVEIYKHSLRTLQHLQIKNDPPKTSFVTEGA